MVYSVISFLPVSVLAMSPRSATEADDTVFIGGSRQDRRNAEFRVILQEVQERLFRGCLHQAPVGTEKLVRIKKNGALGYICLGNYTDFRKKDYGRQGRPFRSPFFVGDLGRVLKRRKKRDYRSRNRASVVCFYVKNQHAGYSLLRFYADHQKNGLQRLVLGICSPFFENR